MKCTKCQAEQLQLEEVRVEAKKYAIANEQQVEIWKKRNMETGAIKYGFYKPGDERHAPGIEVVSQYE